MLEKTPLQNENDTHAIQEGPDKEEARETLLEEALIKDLSRKEQSLSELSELTSVISADIAGDSEGTSPADNEFNPPDTGRTDTEQTDAEQTGTEQTGTEQTGTVGTSKDTGRQRKKSSKKPDIPSVPVHRWFVTLMCMNIPIIGWFYLIILACSRSKGPRRDFAKAYLLYKLLFLLLSLAILAVALHYGLELLDQVLAYMEML